MSDSSNSRRPGTMPGVAVAVILAALGCVLWAVPERFAGPVAPVTDAGQAIGQTLVREPKFKPQIALAGFSYQCSDCHRLFKSPAETTRSLTQHRDIVLEHGINTRCFNCHHLTNRDAFVDDWGREIPYDQPQLLCAKCHGPVYRDWLHGSHGRTNGHWDQAQGPQQRVRCIQCHDPHNPPFPPLAPAPGPSTWRMGPQDLPAEHTGPSNPLRVLELGPHSRPARQESP